MPANMMAIILDVCIVAQLSEYGKKPDVSYCEAIVGADILHQLWTCWASATVACYEFQGFTIRQISEQLVYILMYGNWLF